MNDSYHYPYYKIIFGGNISYKIVTQDLHKYKHQWLN